MEEVTEKDLKSDEVGQIVKKERRQLNAAEEARAVVEQTFTSIASAQKDRQTAKRLRKIPDAPRENFSEEYAQEFEKKATDEIISDKNIAIYDPNNPDRIKK